MSAHVKKEVDTECRVFNQTWTSKYFFTEVKGKDVCLVCGEQVAVLKDYNLNRHYNTKHAEKYGNLTDADRAQTSEALLAKATRLFYQAGCSSQDQLCDIPQDRQKSKPFSEGERVFGGLCCTTMPRGK